MKPPLLSKRFTLAFVAASSLTIAIGCGGEDGSMLPGGSGGASGSAGGSGAGGAPMSGAPGTLAESKTCPSEQFAGEIVVNVSNEGFTGVQGNVLDGVEGLRAVSVVSEHGPCRILQPPEAVQPCQPACGVNEICRANSCVPRPKPIDVGTLVIEGLKAPVEMEANGSAVYNFLGTLPHPGVDEGATVRLTGDGKGGYGPFSLLGWGVALLTVPAEPLEVGMGKPVVVDWTAPGKMGPSQMVINFSLNRHGATDTWLECVVPDNGSFEIDGPIITELFSHGTSGFPSVNLERRSADMTSIPSGCMQFVIAAPAARDLNVEGVVSCSDDDDCPPGKKCGGDLSCVE